MSLANASFDEILDDLSSRFIINVPEEELSSVERICFQIEQAHWFYEDFVRASNASLPSFSLKNFASHFFRHCPLLAPWSGDQEIEQAFANFMMYKTRVPVCGAILLNEALDQCLLVKGWSKSSGWGFPKGKINKDEPEIECAAREVYEETGYDVTPLLKTQDYIELTIREQRIRLYIITDVPQDTPFAPQTRKEISKIEWHRLVDLPTWSKSKQQAETVQANGKIVGRNKFYMVIPFLGKLKHFVNTTRKLRRHRSLHTPKPQQFTILQRESDATDADTSIDEDSFYLGDVTDPAIEQFVYDADTSSLNLTQDHPADITDSSIEQLVYKPKNDSEALKAMLGIISGRTKPTESMASELRPAGSLPAVNEKHSTSSNIYPRESQQPSSFQSPPHPSSSVQTLDPFNPFATSTPTPEQYQVRPSSTPFQFLAPRPQNLLQQNALQKIMRIGLNSSSTSANTSITSHSGPSFVRMRNTEMPMQEHGYASGYTIPGQGGPPPPVENPPQYHTEEDRRRRNMLLNILTSHTQRPAARSEPNAVPSGPNAGSPYFPTEDSHQQNLRYESARNEVTQQQQNLRYESAQKDATPQPSMGYYNQGHDQSHHRVQHELHQQSHVQNQHEQQNNYARASSEAQQQQTPLNYNYQDHVQKQLEQQKQIEQQQKDAAAAVAAAEARRSKVPMSYYYQGHVQKQLELAQRTAHSVKPKEEHKNTLLAILANVAGPPIQERKPTSPNAHALLSILSTKVAEDSAASRSPPSASDHSTPRANNNLDNLFPGIAPKKNSSHALLSVLNKAAAEADLHQRSSSHGSDGSNGSLRQSGHQSQQPPPPPPGMWDLRPAMSKNMGANAPPPLQAPKPQRAFSMPEVPPSPVRPDYTWPVSTASQGAVSGIGQYGQMNGLQHQMPQHQLHHQQPTAMPRAWDDVPPSHEGPLTDLSTPLEHKMSLLSVLAMGQQK